MFKGTFDLPFVMRYDKRSYPEPLADMDSEVIPVEQLDREQAALVLKETIAFAEDVLKALISRREALEARLFELDAAEEAPRGFEPIKGLGRFITVMSR